MATWKEVEAAAAAIAQKTTNAQWNALMDHEQARYRDDARRALAAAERVRLKQMGDIFGPENVT